jgi:hypothetical protein
VTCETRELCLMRCGHAWIMWLAYLHDDGEARAQRVQLHRADVDAIDLDGAATDALLAARRLDQAPQRRDEGRLAGAGAAHLVKRQGRQSRLCGGVRRAGGSASWLSLARARGRASGRIRQWPKRPAAPSTRGATMPTLAHGSMVHETSLSASGSSGR